MNRPSGRSDLNRPSGRSAELAQTCQHGANHEPAHLRLAPKAHFAFGRVDVHIHRRRITFKKYKRERVAPFRQRLMVALDQRVIERAAVDRPLIHKHDHLVPGRTSHAGPADQPMQAHPLPRRVDRHQRIGGLPTKNFRDALGERRALWRTKHRATVFDQRKRRARAREGVEPHALHNVRRLGLIGLEELAASRDRVEQVRHLDARAHGPATIAHVHKLAPVHQNLGPRIAPLLSRL